MKVTRFLTMLFLVMGASVYGQLTIDAELRPRFEYRHGFKTLFPDNTDPAAFVSQRTRLNVGYAMEKLDFYLSIQDVRVWGDVPQLNTSDNNGLAIHQAWGRLKLNPYFSIKLGRQEIAYDNQRIFGSVGWAQQARSHDAALLQYRKNTLKLDVGFAFNQDKESLTGTTLTSNTYKALQYVWLHKNWNSFSASVLLLNNGLQYIDATNATNNQTRYSQTLGTYVKYGKDKLLLIGNFYYQFGKDVFNNNLSAYLLGIDANYKVSNTTKLGLGVEVISGNKNGVPANQTNNAFTPFYGTNHKFNGFMDYFYVGNHANNVGLVDVYVKATFKLNNKSNITAFLHNFSSQATINSTVSKQLGTELDMVYAYKFTKEIGIKAGYSHLFSSEGMEVLKGNTDGNTNNWGWVMVTINPTLFSSKK